MSKNQFGEKARKFVLDNKNNLIQTKRIFDMIYEATQTRNDKLRTEN